jgi:D-alanyl-D-alanine dipeptidase
MACRSSRDTGRPPCQRSYFEQYADELRAATRRYVSPPEIAAHSTGAAVDLTFMSAD